MKTKIILIGASCTGKSTISNMFKDRMGLKIIPSIIREISKKTGAKINEDGGVESQALFFDTYMEILSKNDWQLSDRGMIDVMGYTAWLRDHAEEKGLDKYSVEHEYWREQEAFRVFHDKYGDNIAYIFFPVEFELKDDGVRSKDENYRNETSRNMKGVLDGLGIEYLEVHGDPEERYQQIIDYIGPDFI